MPMDTSLELLARLSLEQFDIQHDKEKSSTNDIQPYPLQISLFYAKCDT